MAAPTVSVSQTLDAVLAALLPTFTVFGREEQARFRSYVTDRAGCADASDDEMLAGILSALGIDVVVLEGGADGRVLATHVAPREAGGETKAAGAGRAARKAGSEDKRFERKAKMLDRQFEKERRSADARKRFLEFQRTGLRAEVGAGDRVRVEAADFGRLGEQRRHVVTGVTWKRMSVWHRRQALAAYGGARDGDDAEYAAAVAAALAAADPTAAMRRIAAPEFDKATGCVVRLAPADTKKKKKKKSPKKTAPKEATVKPAPKKRAKAKKSDHSIFTQCRAMRDRQLAARSRSVQFTGDFIAPNNS